jgi:UDP-N-acetylmuramoylalanine--D-glutamate ligase
MISSSCYLVAGLGKTGHSIARFLQKRQQAFVVFDTRENPEGLAEFHAQFPGVEVFLSDLPDHVYPHLLGVMSSPGVALDGQVMQKCRAMGIPIIGDLECFAREVKRPVIAITGTNGKSTVTTLVGEMARAAGLSVAVAGNIGTPVLDLLDDSTPYDLWVLELSSFQLDLIDSLTPLAATILNITPDHLDRHHDVESYIQAKQRIYHQAQTCLYNRDDELTHPYQHQVAMSFGLDAPTEGCWGLLETADDIYLAQGQELIFPVSSLRIKGRHNWSNALAACALSHAAGIERSFMVQVLGSFPGLVHRSQWVRTLDGVDWINDSKGTNIGATLSAISGIGGSMQGKIILIAGGQGKGADFSVLRPVAADFLRAVVLIGEDADKIQVALADAVPVLRASSLDEAVHLARDEALAGDVVLLSPACASWDMFRDFNHRGEVFMSVVNTL